MNYFSHWKKVRKAILPTSDRMVQAIPTENELLKQSMFSPELMQKLSYDLNCLNKQMYPSRTFEILYDQSNLFHIFQSYVQHNNIIQYVYEFKPNDEENSDLNKFINEFNSYSDLRICECVDYVMTVYIKLVEYYTHLYEMCEKMTDDKRDYPHLRKFDRIMYYRTEICRLLLRYNCVQRLLVEIENGRKFLEKFQNDTNKQENFIYHYHYFINKYTYNCIEATLLQHTNAMNDSKQLCEQSLKELNEAYQNKIWEKILSNTDSDNLPSAKEKRQQYEHSKSNPTKEFSIDYNHISTTTVSDHLN
jgi:hypothetical protein